MCSRSIPTNELARSHKQSLDRLGITSFAYKDEREHSFNAHELAIDNRTLEGKDRAAADLVSEVRDECGNRLFYPSLVIFQRQVIGTATPERPTKRKKKSSSNDEKVFVG